MSKRGLNVYFIHSEKCDYNKLIYLPVLRSEILANHTLVFPDSEANKDKYYKDIMDEADVYIAELTSPDVGFNMQLKYAVMLKKPILALAQKSIGYEEKYQTLLKNVVGYSTEEEIRKYIESFVEEYKDKINAGKVDPTIVLGIIN